MKRLLLIIAMLVGGIVMFAQPRSEEQAKQIAKEFFGKKPQRKATSLSVVPQQKVSETIRKRVSRSKSTSSQHSSCYIINDEDNNRFVIVSADERMYEILGYSNSGCFDPDNAPDGLMMLMSGYEVEHNYVISNYNTIDSHSSKRENVSAISPLIKSKWGQNSPFNLQCPLSSTGNKSVSGCVATAMAQVLNYYKQPIRGQGGREYYTTRSTNTFQMFNYDSLTIDWNSIKDTYRYYYDENGKYQSVPNRTDIENDEVAKLMHACGVSVFMDYDDGSGAFPSDIPYALINHFGYNPNIICVRRECYSNKEWNTMIMEELNAQRPIIYGGQDGDYGGHEFIIDGIDDNGLYHFNFGWYGNGDGYFSIDAIDPNIYKFHLDHDMVIKVAPNIVEGDNANIYFNQFSLNSAINVGDSYKINLSFKLYSNQINSQNFIFDGNVGIGVFDKDWNLINKLYEFDANKLGYYNKIFIQPQYIKWPDYYDDSGLLRFNVKFADSIFGKDDTQLYVAPYAIINSKIVRGRSLNGEKNWYRATTQNGRILFEPNIKIEDPEPPFPPVEYDTVPDWLVGTYNVSALDDINKKTSVWQVSLLKDEGDPTKCWLYNIDGILKEKGFSAAINKVSGYMCKDGKIRIPANQNIDNEYWVKNYQSTDSILVEISKVNKSMDISDAWGISNKSTGEMLSRYTKTHFNLNVHEDSIAMPLINVDEEHHMSISCTTKDVVIKYTYTRHGEDPNNNSTTYNGKVTLEKNGVVKAVAYKDGQSSAISTYNVTSFKVETPDVLQEENHITLTCATEGASIYYVWNGETKQSNTLDIEKSGVIKVYAEKDDFTKSDVRELSLEYIPNQPTPDVLVIANNEAGKLASRISDAEEYSVTHLTISGMINGTDIIFIREMFYNRKLTGLDLENATIVSGGDAYDTTINAVTKDNIIGAYLFENCKQMISIKLPSNAVKIEGHAFDGCKSLKRLDIPASCVEVESMIVSGCNNIEEVNLSDAVQKFPALAVYSCNNITRINASEGNQYFKSVNGVLFTKDSKTIVRYPEGKEDLAYSIPDGVVTIGQDAFDYGKISNITIPNTVTTIESSAFENCKNIQTLTIPNSVTTIGESAFKGCDKLDNVTMSSEVSSIESFTFGSCKNLRKFFIGAKVSNIDKLAFDNCHSLQEFEVDENSNFFTVYAGILYTKDMEELVKCPMALYAEEYIVPNGVKVIRSEAFASCTNVKRFYLPETLTTIGEFAFEKCEMTSIRVPQAVTSISNHAFSGCKNLETFVIPDGVEEIESFILNRCEKMTYVYIPESVKSIGTWAIANNPTLTMINSQIKDIDKVTVSYDAFEKIPSDCTWRVPAGGSKGTDNYEKYANLYKVQPWWVSTWNIIIDEEIAESIDFEDVTIRTFCSECPLDFSDVEGLCAYIASGFSARTGEVIMSRVKQVPAETGLLLVGEKNKSYNVPVKKNDYEYSNLLKGVLKDTVITSGYILNAESESFDTVKKDKTVKAGEAYLGISTKDAKQLRIRFIDTTNIEDGIDSAQPENDLNESWLTLQGTRLNSKPTQKGVYIHNGRKVLLK